MRSREEFTPVLWTWRHHEAVYSHQHREAAVRTPSHLHEKGRKGKASNQKQQKAHDLFCSTEDATMQIRQSHASQWGGQVGELRIAKGVPDGEAATWLESKSMQATTRVSLVPCHLPHHLREQKIK